MEAAMKRNQSKCGIPKLKLLPYREYAGVEMPLAPRTDTLADFGGEYLTRRITFYLRGMF